MVGPYLQQVERPIIFAELSPAAGGIILQMGVVGVDRQCPLHPSLGSFGIARGGEGAGANLRRPRAFRMLAELFFRALEPELGIARRLIGPAQRPEHLLKEDWRLAILGE